MWFELNGDSRLGRCTSEGCGGQPTWRLEAGGVGSDYCSGCKEIIDRRRRKRVYDSYHGEWMDDGPLHPVASS
jgi:hypothetical protein